MSTHALYTSRFVRVCSDFMSDFALPAGSIEKLRAIASNPAYLAAARPHFPPRDAWKTVDDARLWRMVLSQVCVVGSSAGWERMRVDGNAEVTLALGRLIAMNEDARCDAIHSALIRHGVRYAMPNPRECMKTAALLRNLSFVEGLPGGARPYLRQLADMDRDKDRVKRIKRDLAYIKNKGARDLLIELDLGRTLIALDARLIGVLTACGVPVPKNVQGDSAAYEALQQAICELVCSPTGLTGAEFDRVVYRNYDDIRRDLGR